MLLCCWLSDLQMSVHLVMVSGWIWCCYWSLQRNRNVFCRHYCRLKPRFSKNSAKSRSIWNPVEFVADLKGILILVIVAYMLVIDFMFIRRLKSVVVGRKFIHVSQSQKVIKSFLVNWCMYLSFVSSFVFFESVRSGSPIFLKNPAFNFLQVNYRTEAGVWYHVRWS